MKIFDLHNDALIVGGPTANPDAIYAIWTTRLPRGEAARIADRNRDKMLAVEDCAAFADSPDQLLVYGFKYAGLSWNGFNGLAGGVGSDEGLTERGRNIVELLSSGGISLDAAHLNERSFYEAAELTDKIICSHTCFYDVNKHPRNLTSDQISVIIRKGGIVGVCFVADFLGGNTVDDVVRHIDWFLERFGDGNLCIGTDFFGTDDLPIGLTSYDKLDRLVIAMIRKGYSDATIHRILYSNAASYFGRT